MTQTMPPKVTWPSNSAIEQARQVLMSRYSLANQPIDFERLGCALVQRMQQMDLLQTEDYLHWLATSQREAARLLEVACIEGRMLMQPYALWQELQEVLTEYDLHRLPELRVWVPNCGQGEPAYTCALILAAYRDVLPSGAQQAPAQKIYIHATDSIDEDIRQASHGRLRQSMCHNLPPEWVERYLDCRAGYCTLKPAIKGMLRFSRQTSTMPFTPARHDLVVAAPCSRGQQPDCRQPNYLTALTEALKPNGLLFVPDSRYNLIKIPGLARLPDSQAIYSRQPVQVNDMTISDESQINQSEADYQQDEILRLNHTLRSLQNNLHHMEKRHADLQADFASLLALSPAGILLLDQEKRLKQFNSAANQWFSLLENDLGRPVGHLMHQFRALDLDAEVEDVLTRLKNTRLSVTTLDKQRFKLLISVVKGGNQSVKGVVLLVQN